MVQAITVIFQIRIQIFVYPSVCGLRCIQIRKDVFFSSVQNIGGLDEL